MGKFAPNDYSLATQLFTNWKIVLLFLSLVFVYIFMIYIYPKLAEKENE